MARARKRRSRTTRRRLHQEPIVREIARLLDTGTPTKFRYSSAAHHGLRAAMCLKGETWARADSMAGQIVSLALARIGATMPTWRAGQPEPAEREYHYCAQCGGYMQEAAANPWCGDDCRLALWHSRFRRHGGLEELARRRAFGVITGGSPVAAPTRHERQCQHCERPFTSIEREQRFCSKSCAVKARQLGPRDCLICTTSFSPKGSAFYCSPPCVAEARRRQTNARRAKRATLHEPNCRICLKPFKSRWKSHLICSDTCRAEDERRRAPAKRARRRERREAAAASLAKAA